MPGVTRSLRISVHRSRGAAALIPWAISVQSARSTQRANSYGEQYRRRYFANHPINSHINIAVHQLRCRSAAGHSMELADHRCGGDKTINQRVSDVSIPAAIVAIFKVSPHSPVDPNPVCPQRPRSLPCRQQGDGLSPRQSNRTASISLADRSPVRKLPAAPEKAHTARADPLDFFSAFRYLPALPTDCPSKTAIGRPWHVYNRYADPASGRAGGQGRRCLLEPVRDRSSPGATPGANQPQGWRAGDGRSRTSRGTIPEAPVAAAFRPRRRRWFRLQDRRTGPTRLGQAFGQPGPSCSGATGHMPRARPEGMETRLGPYGEAGVRRRAA